MGDLVELSADVLGDVFDDLGVCFGAGKVVAKERLVEGKDALDFDAIGDLEGGVDHLDGVSWMWRCVIEVLVQVRYAQDESAKTWNVQIEDIYTRPREVLASRPFYCKSRREDT